MRKIIKITTILALLTCSSIFSQVPVSRRSRTENKEFDTLAKKFLVTLKAKKYDETKKSWVSFEDIKPLIEKEVKAGRMKTADVEDTKKYFAQRDEVISLRLPLLVKKLESAGYELSKLSFVKASGSVRIRNGQEKANSVDMVFKYDEQTLIKFEVDDALKVDGKWYFSDKPSNHWTVETNGKTKILALEASSVGNVPKKE